MTQSLIDRRGVWRGRRSRDLSASSAERCPRRRCAGRSTFDRRSPPARRLRTTRESCSDRIRRPRDCRGPRAAPTRSRRRPEAHGVVEADAAAALAETRGDRDRCHVGEERDGGGRRRLMGRQARPHGHRTLGALLVGAQRHRAMLDERREEIDLELGHSRRAEEELLRLIGARHIGHCLELALDAVLARDRGGAHRREHHVHRIRRRR